MNAGRLKKILENVEDGTEIFIRNSVNPFGNIQGLDQVEFSTYGFFGTNVDCLILNTDSSKKLEEDKNEDIIDVISTRPST